MSGSGDAQASQKCAKGRPDKDDNSQETPRDGAAYKQEKRKHGGKGQEARIGDITPLGTGRDRARRSRLEGGRGGSKNGSKGRNPEVRTHSD